jgi:hypothetical protein
MDNWCPLVGPFFQKIEDSRGMAVRDLKTDRAVAPIMSRATIILWLTQLSAGSWIGITRLLTIPICGPTQ